mmetsp:Transcript_24712/g.69375  ORF Transcript_24712/g.69375 Transcript_24712/m.69375 type:complete len:452 (-) Transcript_24712:130-1485(-)
MLNTAVGTATMASSSASSAAARACFAAVVLATLAGSADAFSSVLLSASQPGQPSPSRPSRSRIRRPAPSQPLQAVVAELSGGGEGTPDRKFMYMTPEQDRLLVEKGDHEASLMTRVKRLRASKVKVRLSSGGFGGGKQTKADGDTDDDTMQRLAAEANGHAKVLEKEGLVRIDGVLPTKLADDLKEYLVNLRARATGHVEDGTVQDSQERFADVLLNQNRCDLKVPFGPKAVDGAMDHILNASVLRPLITYMFDKHGSDGNQATLYELNCFMSNKGARRQLVHSDNACVEDQVGLDRSEPIMLTCFVALQDTDETMGPTTWIPRTHNVESHRQFYEVDEEHRANNTKDKLLQSSRAVLGTLPKGACVVFDPRVLHCAGANNCKDPSETRAMFYFSFKNPKVDNPGCPSCSGYGIVNADISMANLCDELRARTSGDGGAAASPRLNAIESFP